MTLKEQVLEIIKDRLSMIGDSDFLTSHKATILNEILDIKRSIESKVQEPKVKQLVWEGTFAIAFDINKYRHTQYDIELRKKKVSLFFDNLLVEEFSNIDQAKAYAQEHFDELIRSCYE